MSTPELNILKEGSRTGTSPARAAAAPEGADRFAGLLARQIGRAEGEEKPGREAGGGKVRAEADSRPESANGHGVAQETGRSNGTPVEQDSGPRLAGIDAWQLPLWVSQAAPADAVPLPAPSAPVGLGDLLVAIKSRVAGTVAARFSDRGGVQNLTLRLDPGHLGKVDVQLLAKGDHLSVRITATGHEAEAALRENIKDLADAIRDRTGRFHQVDVKVDLRAQDRADRQPAQGQDNPADDQGRGRSRDQGRHGERNHEPPDDGAAEG